MVEEAKEEKTEEEKTRDRLRGFARTIPSFLMAYGDANTNISNFESNIPDDVFLELTSINKDEFKQLRDGFEYDATNEETGEPIKRQFEGLFNESVFNSSVQAFLEKRTELADYYLAEHSEDIFEYIPPQATNQIFTPKNVVKMMIDGLESHAPELFMRTDSTFIDLYMKSGMYITEIVKKLFTNTRSKYNSDTECVKHILENQVYGLAPTGVLHAITHSLIFGFDESHTISYKNFAQVDLSPFVKGDCSKSVQEKLNELFNGGNKMKFDAVVGNPPYQEKKNTDSKQMVPLFDKFILSAIQIKPSLISLIVPARWYAGGWGMDDLRNKLFKSKRLKVLHDFPNAADGFVNVGIKGGVCYFIYDNTKEHEMTEVITHKGRKVSTQRRKIVDNGIDFFIRDVESYAILRKLWGDVIPPKAERNGMHRIVTGRWPFGANLPTNFESTSDFRLDSKKGDIRCYAKYGKVGFCSRKLITKNQSLIDKHKVYIPYTIGKGDAGKDIWNPFYGEKSSCCTTSFLVCGPFNSKVEADNCIKYIRTKFFRILADIIKNTQSTPRSVYQFIPLQKFVNNNEINWSKSIAEIDKQLYKKYGLSNDEVEFVESHVKSME